MGFLGVYKAVYDYTPQAEGELQITEGDVLYVIEKSADDDWWRAKKKASAEDEDEPVGLIPNNYIEEVCKDELWPDGRASLTGVRIVRPIGTTRGKGSCSLRVHATD